ncbi:hypothetical protein [Ketogulonicigenium vulgare]|uniref:Component of SufBCD complex n=1 Tax=Ketogulonicigenium vulgare (strain WSH-001) TaxID=759362 RepID=F9Y542_KETVW|nr:hypothetical protein [Ketogulonicigenium vulgare]ADO42475.1 conserved hypothetical protein [Ketogulonicigenium vulgare Y25]AEM40674.1 Component of SufBCD complex [Ketogulonicigenium vulgare WSH-001]ALJ82299.1 hypothetical protein KVH_06435 [Ketogulonicigenium vulgare]ANW35000.1 hypothetical protein KvSKV_06405 [Ketogulonicigenium vulgare]AOZ54388.1 hypothetical protein KVC_1373 [Ketogulonicigenium vulgare]
MREIILVRVHYVTPEILAFFDDLVLHSGRDVVFVCDETHRAIEVGEGRLKISLTAKDAAAWGLFAPPNFGWLCGDYFLYAGLKALPDYDRYWLIEGDVRLNMRQSRYFFDRFTASDADILTFHGFKSDGGWYWHYPMAYFTPKVHACLFALVGISHRALAFCLKERIAMSESVARIVPPDAPRRWPNDESFVMSILLNNGFQHLDLNGSGTRFATQDSFTVGAPRSLRALQVQGFDDMIYHPVHHGTAYVQKATAWVKDTLSRKPSEKEIGQIFQQRFYDELAMEATPQQAGEIRDLIRNATR